MYREMLAPARANEADIVCCGYSETDEQGHLSPRAHTGECMVMDRDEAMRRFLVRDRIYSQCWTKIYRRAWLEEHGIRNTPGLKTDEDHIFNLYAFLEARTVCGGRQAAICLHQPQLVALEGLLQETYRPDVCQHDDAPGVRWTVWWANGCRS